MKSPAFRYCAITLVVLAWIALGLTLKLNPNAYLVTTVPVALLTQWLLARRPVAAMWFTRTGQFPAAGGWWLLSLAFAAYPLWRLSHAANAPIEVRLWEVCAVAGAVPLGASFAGFDRNRFEWMKLCLVTGGGIGLVLFTATALVRHSPPHAADVLPRIAHALLVFSRSFALYLPVCFVIEEVFFRGVADPYLAEVDPTPRSGVFVGMLWGLWHIPVALSQSQPLGLLVVAAWLVFFHAIVGKFFSQYCRASGFLLVPAFAHAFIDAVRNAIV